jgi:ATP-dependent helicase/nuclease subunit A
MAMGFSEEQYAKEIVRERLGWIYPYEGALFSKSKYSVSELGAIDRNKRTPFKAIDDTKVAVGNAYHKIMEHIPLNTDKYTQENIKNHVDSLVRRQLLTQEEGEIVNLEKIERFFNSHLGMRMIKAKKVYREIAFNLLSQKDGEEIIVQGVIDCYFQEDGGYILIDFKSGYMKDTEKSVEALRKIYEQQLDLYKKALDEIKGGEVLESYLYSFAIDTAIKV